MSTIKSFTKDPDAVLDYQLDWSEWLATGDTISASAWVVPTGLTLDSDSNTTTKATAVLSGGDLGVTYIVTNRITTVNGLITDRSIEITIAET